MSSAGGGKTGAYTMGAALLMLAACVHPLAPEPITETREQLYSEVIACSGLPTRPMPAIYTIPPEEMPCCAGLWTPGGIYLADSPEGRATFTLRHELLHHLLEGDPHHQHPAWQACGLTPSEQPIVLVLR